jgi:hypothetical protein
MNNFPAKPRPPAELFIEDLQEGCCIIIIVICMLAILHQETGGPALEMLQGGI